MREQQPGAAFQQGALSTAIFPDDRIYSVRLKGQADIIYDIFSVLSSGDSLETQQRLPRFLFQQHSDKDRCTDDRDQNTNR